MQFSKVDYSATPLKEYKMHACKRPSPNDPQPQVFFSVVFANNTVLARSRFCALLNAQYKIKSSQCEILSVEEVQQDTDFELKNYGIDFIYRTGSVVQHGYKEVRHINRVLAVSDLYQEVGSRHKVSADCISVYKIRELKDDEVKKAKILSYTGSEVSFPVFMHVPNTEKEYVPYTVDIFN